MLGRILANLGTFPLNTVLDLRFQMYFSAEINTANLIAATVGGPGAGAASEALGWPTLLRALSGLPVLGASFLLNI